MLVVLLLSQLFFEMSKFGVLAACDCSNSAQIGRRLSSTVQVEFAAADIKGEEFMRPNKGSTQHHSVPSPIRAHTGTTYSTANANSNLGSAQPDYTIVSECSSSQVHFTLGHASDSVIVSFVSHLNASITGSFVDYSSSSSDLQDFIKSNGQSRSSTVLTAMGSNTAFTEEIFIQPTQYNPYMGPVILTPAEILSIQNTYAWAYDKKSGDKWANWYNVSTVQNSLFGYNNPYMYYDSPIIHTVSISGLLPGANYYYRVSGSCTMYHFVLPEPERYPMRIGLTGDIGQTEVSVRSMNALASLYASEGQETDLILLVGDLSYADGYPARWDTFGVLIEPLAAYVPIVTTGGNHEFQYGECGLSYSTRWPTPYLGSGSLNFCYWGREIGVIHMIALCSYAGFMAGSTQFIWLEHYLATRIDRTRTPWLVVMMHTPFYNSNQGHWMEGELMRIAMEPLLFRYGVDIVLSGHVHSYERSLPVFNYTVDECGPVYLNLGDGGNYEGAYSDWRFRNNTAEGPPAAPLWSAFREGSFGVGGLLIQDATVANYSWHRHACQSSDPAAFHMNFSDSCASPQDTSLQRMLTSDSVLIVRPPAASCPNRYVSTATDTPQPEPVIADDDGDHKEISFVVLGLALACGLMLVVCVVLTVSVYYAYVELENRTRLSFQPIGEKLLSNVVVDGDSQNLA